MIIILISSCADSPRKNNLDNYTEIGESEKTLRVSALSGFVQDGSNDKKSDWVSDFEKSSKCKVKIQVAKNEDELISNIEKSKTDVVLGRSNVINELIDKDQVSPLNTGLFTSYSLITENLKNKPFNSMNNQVYSLPVSFSFSVLTFNTEKFSSAVDSWEHFFSSKKMSKNSSVDASIYTVASAALYLKVTNEKLGIKNPFALTDAQFDEVINTLKLQKNNGANYLHSNLEIEKSIISNNPKLGNSELAIAYSLKSRNAPYDFTIPKEGTIGWVDSWAISKSTPNPNCAYLWLNHVTSSEINAKYAQFIGAAPANLESCSFTTQTNHCKLFFKTDNTILNRVTFWTNPSKTCLDGRTDVQCVEYDRYKSEWAKIIGEST